MPTTVPTFVLTKFEIPGASAPQALRLEGRRPGLVGWFLVTIGAGGRLRISATAEQVEVHTTALSGIRTIVIPVGELDSRSSSYSRPLWPLVLTALALLGAFVTYIVMHLIRHRASLPSIALLVVAALSFVVYVRRQRIGLSFGSSGGTLVSLAFRRGIVGGMPVTLATAERIVALLEVLSLEARHPTSADVRPKSAEELVAASWAPIAMKQTQSDEESEATVHAAGAPVVEQHCAPITGAIRLPPETPSVQAIAQWGTSAVPMPFAPTAMESSTESPDASAASIPVISESAATVNATVPEPAAEEQSSFAPRDPHVGRVRSEDAPPGTPLSSIAERRAADIQHEAPPIPPAGASAGTNYRWPVAAALLVLLALGTSAWMLLVRRGELVIENTLFSPIVVIVNSEAPRVVAARQRVSVTAPRRTNVSVEWYAVTDTIGGDPAFALGDSLTANAAHPVTITRRGSEGSRFAPLITNATAGNLHVLVNEGLRVNGHSEAQDCACTIQPGAVHQFIGYFPAFRNSTVRVYDDLGRSADIPDSGGRSDRRSGAVGIRITDQDLH